jgi:hypothetical protein
MSEGLRASPIFSEFRKPTDAAVERFYEQLGLPADPSLDEIEPVFADLWEEGPDSRLAAATLVLGRAIDPAEFEQDVLLAVLLGGTRSDQLTANDAFVALTFRRELESLGPEQIYPAEQAPPTFI